MISASVVLYNTKGKDLKRLLSSYSPNENRRLFVIDNSERKAPYCDRISNEYVEYIFTGKNLGYGKAHNIGIRRAFEIGSDYHLVVNPDVSFKTEILDELVKYADENRDVVYILPKVLNPKGELQYLCKLLPTPFDLIFRRFFPSIGPIKRQNDRYTLKKTGYNRIMNPPCLSGCFMFMRTKTLRKHKLLFDERFFMYCEDFDLIRRLHRVGKTVFYPYCSIVHNHAKQSYKSIKMTIIHIMSACKYFNKFGWFHDEERNIYNKRFQLKSKE